MCEVTTYFHIDIEWYYAVLTIYLISFFTWEGNRLLQPVIEKRIDSVRNKIKYLAPFFISGNVVYFAFTFFYR